MPSTYTTSGLELIATGEQSGVWGDTTNVNLQIVDRLTSRAGTITLSGTTHTLTTSNGTLSDGHFSVLVFAGSPSGTNTVTISPNTIQRVYFVRNTTAQTVVLTQGSGGNVSIAAGLSKIVYTNGGGASAAVFDITNTLSGTFTGNLTGNASTATALQTARTIGGVSFNGTANINLPGVNIGGNQNTTGSAATLTTARTLTIGNTGKTFNGSANVAWSLAEIGVNNSTLTLATSGIATGSQTFTSNQGTNATFTVNVPATNLGYTTAASTGTVTSSTGTNATLPAATTSLAGLMTGADKTKLDGISPGAATGTVTSVAASAGTGISVTGSPITTSGTLVITNTAPHIATNLSATAGTTAGPTINSSTGTNVVIPSASATASGVVTTGTQTFAGAKTFSSTITGSVSGNAGTATALQTARTIGGVSFNGTANINLPGVNTPGNQNTSGTAAVSTAATVTTSAAASAFKVPFVNTTASTTGNYGLLQDSTATFTYNPSSNTLAVGTVSGALSGNATTATTLQTARTIALSGDVTGSTSFDGSGNVSITATVVDDSHNHIIANVDGLQTALDGKLGVSAKAADSNLLDGLDSTAFLRSNAADIMTGALTMQAPIIIDQNDNSGNIAYEIASGCYIPRPLGGQFVTTAAAVTGALAIKLPTQSWNQSDMLSFHVDIYDYGGGAEGESVTLHVYGYQYSTGSWINCGATILSDRTDRDYTVRFGHDGTRHIVYIGETGSTWSYPQVNVRDFQAGYAASFANYDDAFAVTFETTFGTILQTSSNNYPVAKQLEIARTIALSGDVTGSTSFDGSGNVSITATVVDDSHNHVISNVDGLQTALDGKAANTTQTQATWEAGTSTTETIVSPAKVKAAIDAFSGWAYTSAEQTITNGGTLTLAHGLGYVPTDMLLVLRCKTSNAGYTAGDEVVVSDYSTAGQYYGAAIAANSTNIIIKTGNGGYLTINGGFITNASWRYVARAK